MVRDERNIPLSIDKGFAEAVGLKEAVIFAQLQHYLMREGRVKERWRSNKKWVRKTYSEFEDDLPFFSRSTIRRRIRSLVSLGYVQTVEAQEGSPFGNYYTIRYA